MPRPEKSFFIKLKFLVNAGPFLIRLVVTSGSIFCIASRKLGILVPQDLSVSDFKSGIDPYYLLVDVFGQRSKDVFSKIMDTAFLSRHIFVKIICIWFQAKVRLNTAFLSRRFLWVWYWLLIMY